MLAVKMKSTGTVTPIPLDVSLSTGGDVPFSVSLMPSSGQFLARPGATPARIVSLVFSLIGEERGTICGVISNLMSPYWKKVHAPLLRAKGESLIRIIASPVGFAAKEGATPGYG